MLDSLRQEEFSPFNSPKFFPAQCIPVYLTGTKKSSICVS